MRRALLIFVLCFAAVFAVYRKAPVSFLRAESGWYLAISHCDPGIQYRFQRRFFEVSYGGHYTPLAFVAEFQTAKLFGTNAVLWRVRQFLALAALGTAVFVLADSVGGIFALAARARIALGICAAAGVLFQPLMIDLVSWPFMFLQLVWATLTAFSLYALTRMAVSQQKARWAWIAATASYASLHALGLGLATIAAVAVLLGAVLLLDARMPTSGYRAHRRSIGTALLALVCVSLVHAWAMKHLLAVDPNLDPARERLALGTIPLVLGFIPNFLIAGVASFAATAADQPNAWTIRYCWPYGLLLLVGMAAIALRLWRKAAPDGSPEQVTALSLAWFFCVSFLAVIALLAARESQSAGSRIEIPMHLAGVISGPRYVVPLHILLLGPALAGGVWLARRARSAPIVFCALAVASVVAQAEFGRSAYKYVNPAWRVSHQSAWKLTLAMVRECRAAKLAIPNLSMTTLTQEFDSFDLETFAPLVRHDLALPPDATLEFTPWHEGLAAADARYRAVSSLPELEKKLRLVATRP